MSAYIVDTETTGFVGPEPIEIAECLVSIDSVCCLTQHAIHGQRYKPTKAISNGAKATHGILDFELDGCEPSASYKLPEDIEYLIGHQVDFDWEVLGKPLVNAQGKEIKRICTLALSRALFEDTDSHKLSAMMFYILEDDELAREFVKGAHGAAEDVAMTAMLLRYIVEEANIGSMEQLWELSEDSRVPKYMDFGKHAPAPGEPPLLYKDVPRGYLQWMLDQPDMCPYKKKAARLALGFNK